MYRDAAARPALVVALRPLWRPRAIRRVVYAIVVALAVLFFVRRPTTVIHLTRDEVFDHGAGGTLCRRHGWTSCDEVPSIPMPGNPASDFVFSRDDVEDWRFHGSTPTFDYVGGGFPLLPSVLGIFGLAGVALIALRRRTIAIVRIGPELRVDDGPRESSVLASEVRSVEIQPVAERRHRIVFVLVDERRVSIGARTFRMDDALTMRHRVREALARDAKTVDDR